jgi:hypothetical protein
VNRPETLPQNLPAVQEFLASIGKTPPETRVGFVGFDKLDLEKGLTAKAPDGSLRTFLFPWSVLAWQLAGEEGLSTISSVDQERTSPPFTNVLQDLFAIVRHEGRAILILLDEILMWVVEMVRQDKDWLQSLETFFQSLSQAVVATPGTAMVVSLLASDTRYNEGIGQTVASRLSDVLRREQEGLIQPVEKKDVAEVLRRRLFTAASYTNTEAARPQVAAAVEGMVTLESDLERSRGELAEDLRRAYPFDPCLTEVLYQKWTQLPGFQRTRGVLRTFALGLRDAARWDASPLVGPAVFLAPAGEPDLAESLGELVEVADKAVVEGPKQDWRAILEGELEKARQAQEEFALLKHRELEQAVVATFLHSQPSGQKATLGELYRILGQGHPDRIQLGKALEAWARTSWFLDEEGIADLGPDDVPRTWRLGAAPNTPSLPSSPRSLHRCSYQTPCLSSGKARRSRRIVCGSTSRAARSFRSLPRAAMRSLGSSQKQALVTDPAGRRPNPQPLPDTGRGVSQQKSRSGSPFPYREGGWGVRSGGRAYDQGPKADTSVVDRTVCEAVAAGKVWITAGAASLWHEQVPENLDLGDAVLRKPPPLIKPGDFSPEALPEAWSNGETTAVALTLVLSQKAGLTLPWPRVRDDITGAVTARVLTRSSGTWPCGWDQADQVRFRQPGLVEPPPPPPPPPLPPRAPEKPGGIARMSPTQLQLLADTLPRLSELALQQGIELEFVVRLELEGDVSDEALDALNTELEQGDVNLRSGREREGF